MTNGYYHLRTTLLGVDLGFEDDFNYFLLPLYCRSDYFLIARFMLLPRGVHYAESSLLIVRRPL